MKKSCFFDTDEEGNGVVQRSDMFAKMNGRKVFKQAVEKMIGSIMSMCWENKIDLEDVDLFCFHQANLRINQYIQEQLKLPDEKCPANIQRFGNTTAATIPLLLSECVDDGRLKEGMTVACIAFGAGFTWGASLISQEHEGVEIPQVVRLCAHKVQGFRHGLAEGFTLRLCANEFEMPQMKVAVVRVSRR